MSLTLDTAQTSEEFVMFHWEDIVYTDFNFRMEIYQYLGSDVGPNEMTAKETRQIKFFLS